MVATGTAVVTAPGLDMHMIPIGAVLEEGKAYDLAIAFPPETWSCVAESQVGLPFTADGIIEVEDGELEGNASSPILPHLAMQWSPGASGASVDLAKISDGYPPPFTSLDSNDSYGLYVASLAAQDIYSLGWEADVTPSGVLHAWVYEAAGTTRGALISEGTAVAVEGQTRWHDIPVAATLEVGATYNIEIGFGPMNAWSFWEDFTGLPYAVGSVVEVYATSHGGSPDGHRLIHMRVGRCEAPVVAVESDATRPSRFALEPSYPNPVVASGSLSYSLDMPGPVTIALYDVAGRRVATLLDNVVRTAGPGRVGLNVRGLAAGVYFLRMETETKSVSRKITVLR
jgi:hypothetical protein